MPLEHRGTLAPLTRYLAERIDGAPVILPADVFSGRIDPNRKVSFKTSGGTLWDELTQLLEPMGSRLAIRQESIVIESIPRPR